MGTTEIRAKQQSVVTFFFFFFKIFSLKGKMILALTFCFIALIPIMQGDSAVDGFNGMLAATANGDGESGMVKDVSNKAALRELGRLHRKEAVAFLGERQDSPRFGGGRRWKKKRTGGGGGGSSRYLSTEKKEERKEKKEEEKDEEW